MSRQCWQTTKINGRLELICLWVSDRRNVWIIHVTLVLLVFVRFLVYSEHLKISKLYNTFSISSFANFNILFWENLRCYRKICITENNELSATILLDAATREVLNTDVDSGVSELCWDDVEVTCHVCSVVHWRHRESRRVFEVVEAVVDSRAVVWPAVRFTQLAKPRNIRSVDIAATVERHLRASSDGYVLWCTN